MGSSHQRNYSADIACSHEETCSRGNPVLHAAWLVERIPTSGSNHGGKTSLVGAGGLGMVVDHPGDGAVECCQSGDGQSKI